MYIYWQIGRMKNNLQCRYNTANNKCEIYFLKGENFFKKQYFLLGFLYSLWHNLNSHNTIHTTRHLNQSSFVFLHYPQRKQAIYFKYFIAICPHSKLASFFPIRYKSINLIFMYFKMITPKLLCAANLEFFANTSLQRHVFKLVLQSLKPQANNSTT